MEKEGTLDSVLEAEESDNSENWSSESENGGSVVENQGVSEYEKQRLSRMAENKARMEALGLHTMASSLMGSPQKSSLSQKSSRRKGKRKVVVDDEDDEDYRPHDDDKENDDDEDFVGGQSSSKSRRNKVKKKGSEPKKKVPVRNLSSEDFIDKENNDLMQAIALSLQDSAKGTSPKETKGSVHSKEDTGRKKRKKSQFSSRVKMTEDELVLHFFQFDEAGRGVITMKDLKRVATAHDFTWTDKELADMIHLFDNDGDGKLNLQDFHQIVSRCNIIQGPEN